MPRKRPVWKEEGTDKKPHQSGGFQNPWEAPDDGAALARLRSPPCHRAVGIQRCQSRPRPATM